MKKKNQYDQYKRIIILKKSKVLTPLDCKTAIDTRNQEQMRKLVKLSLDSFSPYRVSHIMF
jgi:hypothetical protein